MLAAIAGFPRHGLLAQAEMDLSTESTWSKATANTQATESMIVGVSHLPSFAIATKTEAGTEMTAVI